MHVASFAQILIFQVEVLFFSNRKENMLRIFRINKIELKASM